MPSIYKNVARYPRYLGRFLILPVITDLTLKIAIVSMHLFIWMVEFWAFLTDNSSLILSTSDLRYYESYASIIVSKA